MLALKGMLLTCIAYARAGSCRQFSMVADDVMTDHVTLRDLAELFFYSVMTVLCRVSRVTQM